MYPNRYIYPAFLYIEGDGVSVEFPNLPGCLPCGETPEIALANAKEALGLHLFGMEQDNLIIPTPTSISELHPKDGAVIVLVDTFMPCIRASINNKTVKKTLTIPAWLNYKAEEAGVNFSQILQLGLKMYLGIISDDTTDIHKE